MKKNKKKSNITKSLKIARNVALTILIAFIAIVCLQRFSNNKISFFGYRMFTVISGSMEPKYSIDDILLVKKKDPSAIRVGETISYLGNKGSLNGMVITHEVIKIERDTNGKYWFRAKGLVNPIEDPIISEEQLYGVVIYKTTVLSFIYQIVGTKVGMLIFVFVPIAYIIGSEVIHSLLDKEEKRRQELRKK